jgi:hypothetical protein
MGKSGSRRNCALSRETRCRAPDDQALPPGSRGQGRAGGLGNGERPAQDGGPTVPGRVVDATACRLALLPEPTRALVQTAAVAGRSALASVRWPGRSRGGLTNKVIGQALYISERTAENL